MMARGYRNAFIAALALHLSIVILLLTEHNTERPVLTLEAKNEPGSAPPTEIVPQQAQAIQAVSVDSREVAETVNRLKQERLHVKQAEENRQHALNEQAQLAQKQRIQEQNQLQKLKAESKRMAEAQQKELQKVQQRLAQMALMKAEQEKHISEMKEQQVMMQNQQKQEAVKLAEIQKKKAAELAQATAAKAASAKVELAKAAEAQAQAIKADLAKKQQVASQQAALDAVKNARLAGEVDKYKAMIIGAISRQWILPDNANSSLSSQFRIRLAPNGAVLEVSLTRSSGDPILDRSAQSAIYKASPLPVPSDPTTFDLFRDISLTVRPMKGVTG